MGMSVNGHAARGSRVTQPHNARSMRSLKFTFEVLTLTGMWLPSHWQSERLKRICYHVYTSVAVFGTYTLVALQVLLLVSSEFNVNMFVDIMFTLLTAISICFKVVHFIVRKSKVTQLDEMLFESFCLPRNQVEMEIQRRTDLFIKNFTIIFNALGQATLFCFMITPLLQDKSTRNLPFRMWLPYDLRDDWSYWITYVFEVVPLVVGVLLNVTTDVIVSGFVLQACTQLDLLRCRLDEFPDLVERAILSGQTTQYIERKLLQQAVIHHDFIIRFSKKVTNTFDVIIVEQYLASVLLFSVIVYQFTLRDISVIQRIMAVGYIICMTGEMFAYCWFGNEITLKSMDLGEYVYLINWMTLSKKANKALMFIMMRASRPIIMSYGDLVVLNIDSFKSIMKITYSAFNVLKESGGK
ncbi:odorant receptor Or1-like isoform X2 [Phymastichus coffea]|uniref:odorant receptor Or1-like isoform X2 n=1 Tax=Phymastichus coffea TaxID=108790 RepID=UPI00273A8114|nr:odorant receptor Or1-like isoform X2 [Phymastichus coffea]